MTVPRHPPQGPLMPSLLALLETPETQARGSPRPASQSCRYSCEGWSAPDWRHPRSSQRSCPLGQQRDLAPPVVTTTASMRATRDALRMHGGGRLNHRPPRSSGSCASSSAPYSMVHGPSAAARREPPGHAPRQPTHPISAERLGEDEVEGRRAASRLGRARLSATAVRCSVQRSKLAKPGAHR